MDPVALLRSAPLPGGLPAGLNGTPGAPAFPRPISPAELESLHAPGQTSPLSSPASASGDSFEKTLTGLFQSVSDRQTAATETANRLATGQNVPLHQAMIAMEEASISFQLMVEVRNKLLESYQELMRMQV